MFTLLEKLKLNRRTVDKQSGFTLIEAMIALVVLTMALIPALYLTTTMTGIAALIQDNMIATGLAQEGIEVVRTIRDANWFNNRPFNTGLSDGFYNVNWNSVALSAVGSGQMMLLNNVYTMNAGLPTKFYRTIQITALSAIELRVTINVTWTARGTIAKSVQAEEHLFNWK